MNLIMLKLYAVSLFTFLLCSNVLAAAAFPLKVDIRDITGQHIYADGGRMALNYTMPVDE